MKQVRKTISIVLTNGPQNALAIQTDLEAFLLMRNSLV